MFIGRNDTWLWEQRDTGFLSEYSSSAILRHFDKHKLNECLTRSPQLTHCRNLSSYSVLRVRWATLLTIRLFIVQSQTKQVWCRQDSCWREATTVKLIYCMPKRTPVFLNNCFIWQVRIATIEMMFIISKASDTHLISNILKAVTMKFRLYTAPTRQTLQV